MPPTFVDTARQARILTATEGYRRWAPSYAGETAISYLDTALVDALTPPLAGLRLLDAGCGTGRRLVACTASAAVGVDASAAMLDAGIGQGDIRPGLSTMVGDVRTLPLPDAGFDVVWCRLVVGHLPDCVPAYRELARVAAADATIIVTDFHPAAHAAGHRRTFSDGDVVCEVEHYVHPAAVQVAAAHAAGLTLIARREAAIDDRVRHFYDRAGRSTRFEAHRGLPVVLALAFRRGG